MSNPLISEGLQAAIERLRPELPELLGMDHTTFMAQLDALLAGGSGNQVLNLFKKHPVVDERLQEICDQEEEEEEEEDTLRGGLRLYGDPRPGYIVDPLHGTPTILYRCVKGLHVVAQERVEEFDGPGNALCPVHGVAMIRIVEKGSELSQEHG